MTRLYSPYIRKLFLLCISFLIPCLAHSTVYYNKTGTRYCNTKADWTTNSGGGAGTAPANFTTSGDVFNVRASSVMGQSNNWTVGAGVTVNVYGELQNDQLSSMTFNGTLNVQNGGTLHILSNSGTLSLGNSVTFGATSTMIFEDVANLFDPKYTYGNLTFNDPFNDPSMGTTYPLVVQGNLTITSLYSQFLLATTASLATHSISGNLILNGSNFYVSSGSGSPTLTVGGNVTIGNSSSVFTVSGGSGSPTLTVSGSMSISSGIFNVCSSTGSATVSSGAVTLSSSSAYYQVKTVATSTSSPAVTINGTLYMSGGTFECNRSTGGNPTIHVTGSVIFNNANTSAFHGTSNTGTSTTTIDGNYDMTAGTNTGNVTHVSNDVDGGSSATVGNVTITIYGSLLLGNYGHFDLAYNTYGGNNTVNVYGSAYGTANTMRFAGTHGYNRSNCLSTLVFKSPASGTATGLLSMTTGDFDGGSIDSRYGIGQFNVRIEANRIITLMSDIELGTNRSFTVDAGGTLVTGSAGGTAYKVARRQGGGGYASNTTFTLSGTSGGLYAELDANATPNALQASAFAGNIQTDVRSYSSTANYKFNATAAQSTGDFLTVTSPTVNTVNSLIVNNTASVPTGLTLSAPVTITSSLSFTAGRLITTTTNLATIDVSGTANGYVSSPSNTAYVDGPLAKKMASTSGFTFPVGKSSSGGLYRPVDMAPSSSTTVTYRAELMYTGTSAAGYSTSSIIAPVQWVEPSFFWHLIRTSGINVDPTISFYYGDTDTSATYTKTGFGQWNATSKWQNVLNGLNDASPFHSVRSLSAVPNLPTSATNPFTLVASNSPLPVEMLSFSGTNRGDLNLLEWKTASENNNNYFEVDRSTNGLIFYAIGKVKGAGNSGSVKSYQFTDTSLPAGVSEVYYRLKQVDFDGYYKYSNSIELDIERNASITSLYPSPARDVINFSVTSMGETVEIEIIDLMGRSSLKENRELKPGLNQLQSSVDKLENGMYFLKISSGTGLINFKKFMVSKG